MSGVLLQEVVMSGVEPPDVPACGENRYCSDRFLPYQVRVETARHVCAAVLAPAKLPEWTVVIA